MLAYFFFGKTELRYGYITHFGNYCSLSSLRTVSHLMTLEALCINEMKPSLITKDEYRFRALVIKI